MTAQGEKHVFDKVSELYHDLWMNIFMNTMIYQVKKRRVSISIYSY